jgi:hypothetical protein
MSSLLSFLADVLTRKKETRASIRAAMQRRHYFRTKRGNRGMACEEVGANRGI